MPARARSSAAPDRVEHALEPLERGGRPRSRKIADLERIPAGSRAAVVVDPARHGSAPTSAVTFLSCGVTGMPWNEAICQCARP
jgi:hypothetical protein